MPELINVADRLARIAAQMPDAIAIAAARRGGYSTCTFHELDADASALALGLLEIGVRPGHRIVLLVKPGVEFVKLVFALLRTGAVTVLVDPGMGRKHLVNCLAASEPDGFVAISRAQALRTLLRGRFPRAQHNVTVGRRWFWGGPMYEQVLNRGRTGRAELPVTRADDPAAIIFTSGSTGPPKGVLYTHRMFDTQAAEIQRAYRIQPGGVDLACFALFGLFNSAMGVTTVFPDMDFSRPASADPTKLLAAANHWQVTQAFASPAVWDKLSRHGESKRGLARGPAEDQPPNETTSVPVPFSIPTLRKIFSCGAPVPAVVLQRTLAMVHPKVEMHTPYGATEALPIATIEAQQVLSETAAKTSQGAGVCVGRKFGSIEWKIIRISDEPIGDISEAQELPPNQIGELIVRGPQVSPEYVLALQPQAEDANAAAKIRDGNTNWHRMGDVGYFDDQHRFWYCGRKSHRVETAEGTLYTECVEAIFNEVCGGPRCALVGMKSRNEQLAVLVVSIFGMGIDPQHQKRINFQWGFLEQLLRERSSVVESTRGIAHFLPYPRPLPVDVRHNSKINREQLAAWAADQLQKNPGAFSPRSVTGG